MSQLTGKQRRYLRALGQRLAATLFVGAQVLGRTALLYRARKQEPTTIVLPRAAGQDQGDDQ